MRTRSAIGAPGTCWPGMVNVPRIGVGLLSAPAPAGLGALGEASVTVLSTPQVHGVREVRHGGAERCTVQRDGASVGGMEEDGAGGAIGQGDEDVGELVGAADSSTASGATDSSGAPAVLVMANGGRLTPYRKGDGRASAAGKRGAAAREAQRAIARADIVAVSDELRRLAASHHRDELGPVAVAAAL